MEVIRAIQNFINPFEIDNKEVFYCLSSSDPIHSALKKIFFKPTKLEKKHT